MPTEYTCLRCGTTFTDKPSHPRRYCSPRRAQPGTPHRCLYCNAPFHANPGAQRRYCGMACYRAHAALHPGGVLYTCLTCGTRFRDKPSHPRLYCSPACVQRRGSRIALAERFWAKVQQTAHCWFWTGARGRTGYGHFSLGAGQRMAYAHRVSWELHYGPVPDGLLVLHHCDVRHCVRPDHLFLGTARDNTQDMIAKGRDRFRDNLPQRQH